jgi:hypothetical protein
MIKGCEHFEIRDIIAGYGRLENTKDYLIVGHEGSSHCRTRKTISL